MANTKDCPGFETFGADVKEAWKVKQLSHKTLANRSISTGGPTVSSITPVPGSSPVLPLGKQIKVGPHSA